MIITKGTFYLILHMIAIVINLLVLTVRPALASSGVENSTIRCIERERQALLKLKNELVDNYGRLSSWGTVGSPKDCCLWNGVHCDNGTNYIIMLDLHGPMVYDAKSSSYWPSAPLKGKVSPSLLELPHLVYLDISFNDFNFSPIPEFVGSLSQLQYLNLSYANFGGPVPHHLANLTRLQFLDLKHNYDALVDHNLNWISHLRLLRYLDLSFVDLRSTTDWIQAVTSLPLLKELHLYLCRPPSILPPIYLINSSASLATLDLSYNNLSSSSIYPWLFNFSNSLSYLDISNNNLQGPIPDAFEKMISLEHLFVEYSNLEGGVPRSFGNLTSLKSLDLRENNLTGQLPKLMMNLSGHSSGSLMSLDLSWNELSGSLPDISTFSSLSELRLQRNKLDGSFHQGFGQVNNLIILDVSGNQLSGAVPGLTSYFPSLGELYLEQNQLNGSLTQSIGGLSKLEILNLASNHFEGVISEGHLLNLSQLRVLDMSFNSLLSFQFSSDWLPPFNLNSLALSYVNLGIQFPKWLQKQGHLSKLDISAAGISDTIPSWFWDLSPTLTYLNLSNNRIYGVLPNLSSKFSSSSMIDLSSNNLSGLVPPFPHDVAMLNLSKNKLSGPVHFICNSISWLSFLDLSDNLLSGELPDCWTDSKVLKVLNLANNNLSGEIPFSIGSLLYINALHLRNNNFSGEIPMSLGNSKYLQIIDIGENKIAGNITTWMGDSFLDLVVLSLRMNEFYGTLPSNLCNLAKIQILDLSLNNISGAIPECLNNLTAMTLDGSSSQTIQFNYAQTFDNQSRIVTFYYDIASAFLTWKGTVFEYRNKLGLVRSIDLSSNNLTGELPAKITSLRGLIGLNLSRNKLTGTIPTYFDQLQFLNFLDLSRNQFLGDIPTGISQLSHLGVLDLSYNNLSGRIPLSTQMQTFNASSFMGNSGLCGIPLSKVCAGDEVPQGPGNEMNNQEQDDTIRDFFISMAFGFIIGFWGFWGTLLFKRSWRYSFFRFLNSVGDWLCMTLAVNKARRKHRGSRK